MVATFDDGKDAGALRTIGEVGDALGIKSHVLRYWEGQFPMLQPLKRSGGRRYYRSEDIALVQEIDRLVNREGYTLRGAKAALKDWRGGTGERTGGNVDPAPGVLQAATSSATSDSSRQEAIARLRTIRERLADAIAR